MTEQIRVAGPRPYLLSVSDYLALDESGAFRGLRTELIGGEVIVMSPLYRPHAFVRDELAYRVRRGLEDLGSDLYVSTDGSVDMTDHDLPQPDITLTREPRGEGAIPLGSIALIVEVSDSSLRFDLDVKAPLYARHAVAEYWVADVNGRVIHQMWGPTPTGYQSDVSVPFGDTINSKVIGDLRVETGGL